MTVETQVVEDKTKLVNDIDGNTVISTVSEDKMAALRAKMANKKEESMPMKIVEKKKKSIKVGLIGSGAGGSKLAAEFYKLGYDTVCINTASQDLEYVNIPEQNKLLLSYTLGGAAKDLAIGNAAAENNRDSIFELVHDRLADSQMLMITTSLGGGSGAGSMDVVIDVASSTGKPVVVMAILPLNNDDAQTKKNSLETLSKLTQHVQSKKIHNLFVVDNARIETLLSNVSALDFFDVANEAIVRPLEMFNTLSTQPSSHVALDSMEFAKLLTDGNGLSVYGESTVTDFTDETALAEAIVNSSSGMLATGFDFGGAKYVGVMISAPKSVWDQIPASSLHYAMTMIDELCKSPAGVFKGIYKTEGTEQSVKIYTMFSGLGLPDSRVNQLKRETEVLEQKNKQKEVERNLALKIDLNKDETVSAADKIKAKIAQKNSAFGTFVGGVVDRRKS